MRWKSRFIAFILCFAIGFLVAAIVAGILSRNLNRQSRATTSPCATADYFNSPEEVLAALKSPEVELRRAIFHRLLLRPGVATVYYDYERDLHYPERADRAKLQYVQLDDSPQTEALLTFVRLEHPLALVFSKKSCGWQLVAALSSWLRFEDYPYENWLSLPQAIEPGIHQLLVRDSNGDSTSYLRKARLLRLNGDALTQIAEIEEEAIEPIGGYDGSDGNDVKRHRINKYSFLGGGAYQGATITNEVTDEIIKLNGAAPGYSYWLETDGSWHARQSNWNRRPATRVKLLNVTRQFLVWNSQEGRFVKP
jgi:hypothetical protein